MITPIERYIIECNRCHLMDEEDYEDGKDAELGAHENGWMQINSENETFHFCPECSKTILTLLSRQKFI